MSEMSLATTIGLESTHSSCLLWSNDV